MQTNSKYLPYIGELDAVRLAANQSPGLSFLENYPNPFHSETYIQFSVRIAGNAEVRIFDMMEKEVATIFNDFAESGKPYSLRFDAGSLPAGIYFARLKCGNQYWTNKMVLLK
ncbi:MAG TPA: T9SS type A sorting domain-containing protein [Bacteroides sp.]|nr:T9SS type A sorting domain-containing protein [Bacteroides sp.]